MFGNRARLTAAVVATPRISHRDSTTTVEGQTTALNSDVTTALLAEYNTLRTESLLGIENRISIVTFSFGAISVLIAGLLNSNAPKLLTGAIAILVIPQVAKASILMWMGEYRRSSRAGAGIKRVEEQINTLLGRHLLQWESSLVSTKAHMGYPYLATIFFVLFASYASSLVGLYLLGEYFAVTAYSVTETIKPLIPNAWLEYVPANLLTPRLFFYLCVSTLVVVTEFMFYVFVRLKWREARKPFN